jgi:hypothetical protein
MEIYNFKIFLLFWRQEKQNHRLSPVDYDISPLSIAEFSNCKALAKALF